MPKYNRKTIYIMQQLTGFMRSHNKVNATAKEVLPYDYMSRYPSFNDGTIQINFTTITALLALAVGILPLFTALITKIALEAGVDVDAEVEWDGSKLAIDDKKYFTGVTFAPLKSVARCEEKVKNEYGGDVNRLVDAIRCSIVVNTETELVGVAEALQKHAKIVRLKNRFKEPLWYVFSLPIAVFLLLSVYIYTHLYFYMYI